ncbi:hypothetical protein [Acetobacteroides hydrogenigenes]|uniref:Major capsid protein E n=1 Tax=Acetobacteroides hydrogenigenes TaxID=979970 RepID=A0A4R2E9U5_9BACT|nr:hypothetical protein [Acetobacteroides hydrogenigenes]TCN63686.1 hypothetical protein CLV25_11536 [Acetobacteroides hydrogenigenes]
MKAFKLFASVLLSILVSTVMGGSVAVAASLPVLPTIGAFTVASFIPTGLTGGFSMATVYKEVWTGEVINALSTAENATFLDGIANYDKYVSAVGDEAQAIHLVYMGVEPDVLINNTTYPIPLQTLDQEDVVITLDKYQTKVTPVTDDELYALSYKKIQTVKDRHASAIAKSKIAKAIHALAPSGDTEKMPVILTTGADDGTGRKKLVWADLLILKRKLDALQVPAEGRRLVLNNDHLNDLLESDEKFRDQFYSANGTLYNRYGFEFYNYVNMPYYTVATKAKKSFGATPAVGDRQASVFFSLERAAKATGWTKMYYAEAATNPRTQQNEVNFRHNFIVMPTREEARGAIISASV